MIIRQQTGVYKKKTIMNYCEREKFTNVFQGIYRRQTTFETFLVGNNIKMNIT